jgi:acetylglutamate kinase
MLPKIGSALDAVKNGVRLAHHRRPRRARAAARGADQRGVGTMIRADEPAHA